MSFTAIFSAIANACGLAMQLIGLKNTPEIRRAEAVKVDEKIDETNTLAVQKAIETGNLDDLRK